MQNPLSVTTQAFDGVVGDISIEIGISDKRIYRILADHDPYLKLWRYLTPLGRIAPDRLELVRADFNARCDRLVRGRTEPSTIRSLHKETSEAVQSVIERAPREERRRQLTEAIAELQKQLDQLDHGDQAVARTLERFGVDARTNIANADAAIHFIPANGPIPYDAGTAGLDFSDKEEQ